MLLKWANSLRMDEAIVKSVRADSNTCVDLARCLDLPLRPFGDASLMTSELPKLLIGLFVLAVAGCASVPEESVELSRLIGSDLVALKSSHQALVSAYHDGLRAQANAFIDSEWKPKYLRKFIRQGKLVEAAQEGDPNVVLERVGYWAELAVRRIESRRRELLDPIDDSEAKLLQAVDQAFSRMIAANAVVTAHLESVRDVATMQDRLLEAFGVADTRDEINNALIEISDKAAAGIAQLREVQAAVPTSESTP